MKLHVTLVQMSNMCAKSLVSRDKHNKDLYHCKKTIKKNHSALESGYHDVINQESLIKP